jgi:phosphoribosylamine--glycine ligase
MPLYKFNGTLPKGYDLVIIDDIEFGEVAVKLRKEGFNVVGGTPFSDLVEADRMFAFEMCTRLGIGMPTTIPFDSFDRAIQFVRRNPARWVIKQNGNMPKTLNYVGKFDDGSDTIEMLRYYKTHWKGEVDFVLQRFVEGQEVAIGGWVGKNGFIEPFFINFEHKKLMNDDIGVSTGEMGTIGTYTKLPQLVERMKHTLLKFEPHLVAEGYIGYFDANCILTENDVFVLEYTCRFGYPTTPLQIELHSGAWTDFLVGLVEGNNLLMVKDAWGIVVVLTAPPFPYEINSKVLSPDGLPVFVKNYEEIKQHIHIENIQRIDPIDVGDGWQIVFRVAGQDGYVLTITYSDEDLLNAIDGVYRLIEENIYFPRMMYRTDIGRRVHQLLISGVFDKEEKDGQLIPIGRKVLGDHWTWEWW